VEKVFETNTKEANLQKIATDLKLNTEPWATCATDAATKKQLSDAIAEAKYLGIPNVPNVFINNKQINLTKNIDLEQLLNSLIAP
jgi:protein-disulfide isomerase